MKVPELISCGKRENFWSFSRIKWNSLINHKTCIHKKLHWSSKEVHNLCRSILCVNYMLLLIEKDTTHIPIYSLVL